MHMYLYGPDKKPVAEVQKQAQVSPPSLILHAEHYAFTVLAHNKPKTYTYEHTKPRISTCFYNESYVFFLRE